MQYKTKTYILIIVTSTAFLNLDFIHSIYVIICINFNYFKNTSYFSMQHVYNTNNIKRYYFDDFKNTKKINFSFKI